MNKPNNQKLKDKGTVTTEFFRKRGKMELMKDFGLDPERFDFVGIKFVFANKYPRKEHFIFYYCDKKEVGETYKEQMEFNEERGYLPIYKKKLDLSLEYLLGNYIKKLELATHGPGETSYREFNLKVRNMNTMPIEN
ncbi:MAG: hypothetical protein FXF47_01415 [Candidatus Mcinerneyibacterium aminivorans]|uniref:Uncharacterized protein n=1 Tax=Candidatus Mcinerneyibacterium aminivorans TaxID=2703815 RepID=A0A5D0MHT3_9BACT|nr:MAG: hypothetical protein FXF47_01415 [Candidatus Mcinerneyibacterium aminivorans]